MKKFILLFIASTLLSGFLFNSCDEGEELVLPEYAVGKSYGGGTIIMLDDSKEHGIIASRKENIADSITWQQANNKCKALTHEGYSDWRLPTKEELIAIQSIREMVVGSLAEVSGYCWSSEVIRDSVYVLNLSPGANDKDSFYVPKDSLYHLRVVREF